jgi:hypothetical protein
VVIWYIFPVLVLCTEKNLATLSATAEPRPDFSTKKAARFFAGKKSTNELDRAAKRTDALKSGLFPLNRMLVVYPNYSPPPTPLPPAA